LLIVLDCKGGRDARTKAERTRRLLYGAGARRVAIWPDAARLSPWELPPQDLAVRLYPMIDTGTGNGADYAAILPAPVTLAVSARVPLSNLYERGRSLGIGVQVSAQSWQGLGATEDERYRIAATADGGVFVLHTPYPEPLVALAGTRRVLETAHKVIGNAWGDEGTTREQRASTADPDLVRRLDVGQACYIHRGAATFVQVARPRPS